MHMFRGEAVAREALGADFDAVAGAESSGCGVVGLC